MFVHICEKCRHWPNCSFAALVESESLLKDVAKSLQKVLGAYTPEGTPQTSFFVTECPSFKPSFKDSSKDDDLKQLVPYQALLS